MLLLLALATIACVAQDNTEQELKKASDANITAFLHGDVVALQNQYTDDYYRTGATGKVSGKVDLLKDVADHKQRLADLQLSDRVFRVYGDTAVETGELTAKYQRDGKEQESRYTAVWRKQNGTWKKAVYQVTSLTPLPPDAYNH